MFLVSSVIILDAHRRHLLGLLEAFMFTVGTILGLNHSRSFSHLLPIQVLKKAVRELMTARHTGSPLQPVSNNEKTTPRTFYLLVSSIVVLNENRRFGLRLLFLPALVRPVGLLDNLSRLVELPLFLVRQCQIAQISLAFQRGLTT